MQRRAHTDVFWDIGANYGFMSIYVQRSGSVKCVAFEPNPIVLEELERNLSINGCEDVTVERSCLSDRIGVEGAEHLVVSGGRELLARANIAILAEYNVESIAAAHLLGDDYLRLFRELGYRIFVLRRPWWGRYRWQPKAGAGADIERYRGRAAQEGLADAVFHGMVSDPERLRALFGAADLLVLPTYNEGFPRVLYEAMTHGVPVVTTFVGGIPSVMRDGENCVRIEARDAADLSATVEKVLADPALRRHVAEGGIATMREILAPGCPSHARQVAERLPGLGR